MITKNKRSRFISYLKPIVEDYFDGNPTQRIIPTIKWGHARGPSKGPKHLSLSLSKILVMAKRISLLVVCFSLLAVYVAAEALSGEDGDALIRQVVDENGEVRLGADHHFSLFKTKFGKSYASQEEHDYRFNVFKSNLRRARRHQRLDPSASHGVTRFSDLTPAEFRRTFLGLRSRLRLPSDANKAPILPTEDLPEDFDWRDRGAVTPVKNQVFFFLYIYLFLHI